MAPGCICRWWLQRRLFSILKFKSVAYWNVKSFMVFFCSLTFFIHTVSAQKSKTQLEKEKEENLNKITETSKILNETKTQKKATLGQLNAIQQQIAARNSLIISISEEIAIIDEEIGEMQDIIAALERDMSNLKEEYAFMIYSASKSHKYYDRLTFIFGAHTFNQVVKRIKYFKQYSGARKNQVRQIQIVTSFLSGQRNKLSKKREEKNKLLTSKTIETQSLTQLRDYQNHVVRELTNKEKELKRELDERKKSVKNLEKLITDLINAEREKAIREAEKKGRMVKSTPEVTELSHSFAGNVSKLPWPVVHGNIAHKFGKQPHQVLKGVYVDNLGVDIQTLKKEPVRAVFKGKVITVASVPGMNNVVMIQHGEYFTVYAKLKSVSVSTGQEVKAKDSIGEVYTDKNGVSELQFQVWKNSEKLDPEKWLHPK
jgi:septal ring factor EnvC (AmiA/AmiB activator)